VGKTTVIYVKFLPNAARQKLSKSQNRPMFHGAIPNITLKSLFFIETRRESKTHYKSTTCWLVKIVTIIQPVDFGRISADLVGIQTDLHTLAVCV